ncbi:glycosyltransferase, partial [Arthrospira platensis SPKY2]
KRKGIDLFMILSNKLTYCNRQKVNYLWYSVSQSKFKYIDSNVKESNVQWMPFSQEFNLALLNASAFLLTSRDDPAPLVALEALACDKPVFCFQT